MICKKSRLCGQNINYWYIILLIKKVSKIFVSAHAHTSNNIDPSLPPLSHPAKKKKKKRQTPRINFVKFKKHVVWQNFFENFNKMKQLASVCHDNKISNLQCYLQRSYTVNKPERWTYEKRYTKVKDKRAAIYPAITTFPSHSGVPPGFLQSNVWIRCLYLKIYLYVTNGWWKQWSSLTTMETIVKRWWMQLSQGGDDSGSKVKIKKMATMIIITS